MKNNHSRQTKLITNTIGGDIPSMLIQVLDCSRGVRTADTHNPLTNPMLDMVSRIDGDTHSHTGLAGRYDNNELELKPLIPPRCARKCI